MVCEAREREEQTQFAVVIFRGTELLQAMETLDCLLHGELQLKKRKRNILQTLTDDSVKAFLRTAKTEKLCTVYKSFVSS